MDYKTHFFLQKIDSKIQVHLILEINIKVPVFDLKFPPVLKIAIYSMPWETYLYLATMDSTGSSSVEMQRIWVVGIHKLAYTVSLPPCHRKPRTLSSLCCVIAVYGASELELKVICIIGNSTIFLLVASFVMEKNKRYSYDAGYKWKVIPYAEEHGKRAAEQHFGLPPTEKIICNWRASKE